MFSLLSIHTTDISQLFSFSYSGHVQSLIGLKSYRFASLFSPTLGCHFSYHYAYVSPCVSPVYPYLYVPGHILVSMSLSLVSMSPLGIQSYPVLSPFPLLFTKFRVISRGGKVI